MPLLRLTWVAVAAVLCTAASFTDQSAPSTAAALLAADGQERSERAELAAQNEQQEAAIVTLRRTISELSAITADQAAVLERLLLLQQRAAGDVAPAGQASAGQSSGIETPRLLWNGTLLESVGEKLSALKATVTQQRIHDAMWQNQISLQVQSAGRAGGPVGDVAGAETPQARDSRLLSTSEPLCGGGNATGDTPKLYIEGVCSVSDVVVQGRSTDARLNALESDVEALLSPQLCDTAAMWNPRIVASLMDENAFGRPANLVLSADGRYAYVTGFEADSVAILDLFQSPLTPTVVGSITGDTTNLKSAHGLALSPDGRHLFVAAFESKSLAVVDVSNAEAPKIVSAVASLDLGGALAVAVAPDGRHAYVTSSTNNGLVVIDVSDVSNATIVGTVWANTSQLALPRSVVLSPNGDFAFVTGTSSKSLAVVNISIPEAPHVIGSVAGNFMQKASDLAISPDGRHVYVGGFKSSSLAVVDVSDPSHPLLAGALVDGQNLDAPIAIALSPDGSLAFISCKSSTSVAVVDVTSPQQPVLIGTLSDGQAFAGLRGVRLSPDGRTVYVLASNIDTIHAVRFWDFFCAVN